MGDDSPWIVEANKPAHEWRTIAIVPMPEDGEDDEIPRVEAEANLRLMTAAPTLLKALADVRQELWVDYCLQMGRTDVDPSRFNARPHIRIIDEAIAMATVPA